MVIGTHVPGNGVYSQPEAPKARRGGRVASGPHPKCEQQDCVRPARLLKGGLCEPCRAADYYRRKSPHVVGCNLAKCTKAVGEQLRLVG